MENLPSEMPFSVTSIVECMNTLQEDSELEGSSARSVQMDWENTSTEKINMKNVSIKSFVTEETEKKTQFRKMYLVALAALTNALCMGFGGTYTATATNDMTRNDSSVQPTEGQIGWIGSFLPLGALFGGLVAGHLSQSLGRKGVLLFSSLPFMTGWLLIAYAKSVEYIYAGRAIIGFCCGLVSVTTPMYLVEISTPDVRGLLGASFQLFVTIGIFLVACLGTVMYWTWLAVSGACLTLVTMVMIMLIPESPRWLMSKGKKEKALKVIKFLQGDFLDASQECKAIESDIKSQPTGSFQCRELVMPEVYKPALLSFLLMFFQQCSSVNAILFYTAHIFEKAGSTMSPNVCTILVALVQMFATAASSFLMDRSGRKVLLLISGALMAISLAVFGAFDLVAVENHDMEQTIRAQYGWLPLLSLIVFISAFSLGFGPIPWLMVSEMTTPRFRSATSGAATALNWAFAFAVTNSYNDLTAGMKDYGAYFFYSFVCLLSCVFTTFLVPETKGKDMEEIREYFLPKKHGSIRMVEENERY